MDSLVYILWLFLYSCYMVHYSCYMDTITEYSYITATWIFSEYNIWLFSVFLLHELLFLLHGLLLLEYSPPLTSPSPLESLTFLFTRIRPSLLSTWANTLSNLLWHHLHKHQCNLQLLLQLIILGSFCAFRKYKNWTCLFNVAENMKGQLMLANRREG